MPGSQQQPDDPTSRHPPHGMNFGHQLDGTILHDEPNGILPTIEHSPDDILPTIEHSPNSIDSQYEQDESNRQHQ